MEKIYMHDNQNQKVRRARKRGSSVTAVLVAIVAVAALIAVGFGQISFAIPEEGITLGKEFTSATPDIQSMVYGSTSNFGVNSLLTDKGQHVFCIERDIDYKGNLKYVKSKRVLDSGLLYIMSNVYPNKKIMDGENELPVGVQVWLSQSAVWIYAAANGYENNTEMTAEVVEDILYETELYAKDGTTLISITQEDKDAGYVSLFDKYGLLKLLNEAQKLGTSPSNSLDVTKKSEGVSMTSDGKYYQTGFVDVVGTVLSESIGSFNGFELKLNKAPEGTIVVDKDGKEITDLTSLAPGTKFAFKIPVDKVKEENKKMEVSVLGSFDSYAADIYVADTSQTVTSVSKINNNLSVPLNLELNYTPTVPNTALDNSATLYIIGLILLLSGLGIFYTSAKKN